MLRVDSSVAWLVVVICLDSVTSLRCPANCDCEVKSSDQYKVKCNGGDIMEEFDSTILPPKTILLDLSRYKIKVLRKKAFSGLASLKKLILTNNHIRIIEDGTFLGLDSLTRLILSSNKIMFFNRTSFKGLPKLKNLDLSDNNFVTLPDGMFSHLPSLKKLQLQDVQNLLCDCQLKWFAKYIKGSRVDVKGQCFYPKAKEGMKLKLLKPKEMTCGPLDLPEFRFHPNDAAITIIEGDPETFSCIGTWRPKTRIQWYKDSSPVDPTKLTEKLRIATYVSYEKMQISSNFEFKWLTIADTGIYKCNLSNPSGYIIGQIHLEVLSSKSKYCEAETTETNRGTFYWYDTVARGITQAVCPRGNINTWLKDPPKAYARRNCSATGEWLDIEGEQCAFSNQRTQALYRLSQAPMNSTFAVAYCSYKLRNITSYSSQFVSKWDVIYASRTIERISHQMRGKDKRIAEDLVVVVSNMMETKPSLLTQAQSSSYRSCTRMVLVLDYFHTWFPGKREDYREVHFESNNIVYEAIEVNPLDTVGKTCVAFSRQNGKGRAVECVKWQNYTSYNPHREIEASIHFSPFPFTPTKHIARRAAMIPSFKLQFIVYRNGKLFTNGNSSRSDGNLKEVATSVVLLRLGGLNFDNLTKPAVFKLKNHQYGTDPVPVYWDFKAHGGVGAWVKDRGCRLSADSNSNYTIVKCYQLMNNYFAVMMVVKSAAVGQIGPPFLIHPAVYFGAALCAFFLFVTLLIYIFFRELRFNRDDAAMLMNECLALLVVVIMFITGINNVSNTLLCRAVGVLLHYFLLCALLWVGCGGICLHRLIRTSLVPEEFNPVLRYYMISWGIPLIVCGITVAGNPDNYNVQDYCWLRPNPFLGAFLGPACLVLVVNIIVLVRLHNLIIATFDNLARPETDPQSSEPPGEKATTRLELLQRLAAIPTLPTRRECMDHLVASGLVLLLILINFLLALVLVGYQSKQYLTIIFSCGYAVANILLGAVIFVFHCCRKSKVKELCAGMNKENCCPRQKYTVESNVNPGDVAESEANAVTAPLMNGEAGKHVYEEIPHVHHVHGATTNAGSDNVSLPSSAALTIDRQLSVDDRTADNEPSLSDKHSSVSAPLPLKYSRHFKDRPPGYRHSYCESESVVSPGNKHKEIKTLDFGVLAPLALPESMTPSSKAAHSSRESVPRHKTDSIGKAPSEQAPSERSFGKDYMSNNKHGSRTPSEASMPPMEKRPSIPGASSELSIDGKPTYMLPRRQKPYNFIPMPSKDQPYKVVPKQLFYASPTIQEYPGRQSNRPVNGVIYDFPQGSVPRNHYGTQQYQRQNCQVPVQQPSDLNPRQRPRGNSTDSEVTREKRSSREGMLNHVKDRQDSTKSSRTLVKREPKEVRVKPEPKEWIPPTPKFVYVPVPHILKKQKQSHNETSV